MVRWTDGYGDDIVCGAHFRLSSLISVLSPRHNTQDKTRAPVFIVNRQTNDSPGRRRLVGGGWWVVGGGIKLSVLTQKSGQYLDVIKMGLSKNRGREYWLVKISAR